MFNDLIAKVAARSLPPDVMRDTRYFHHWEQHGYHVTPVHFYQPIPDTRTLSEQTWQRRSEMPGIDLREQAQLDLLERIERQYRDEYDAFPDDDTGTSWQYHLDQDMFRCVDAEMLYGLIRDLKPRRVLEIGSGMSTLLAAQAVRVNEAQGHPCHLVAIEPHPGSRLRAGVPGLADLIDKPVQQVPMTVFAELDENDILFIDSSHVLALSSDVQYEYLEILPRLQVGVHVHVHDIWLPAEYPREWVIDKCRFWNEQYLLQAFLACNACFEVVWGSSYMRLTHDDRLREAFPSYARLGHEPVSFWMRRKR